ncbi:hypothetical protein [Leptolyngbya sp. PCC 6406]|uniref:hypothetical protein n=1 Tax=Leptolyngbya sp. PCC 6406 TaxID=1173264 RepID=UPI0002AC0D1E|nr:hypothetical protein [Leptolyngbya sp. PCC 6406]
MPATLGPTCRADEEAAQGMVQVKWLATGEQAAQSQADLLANVDGLRSQIRTAQH